MILVRGLVGDFQIVGETPGRSAAPETAVDQPVDDHPHGVCFVPFRGLPSRGSPPSSTLCFEIVPENRAF